MKGMRTVTVMTVITVIRAITLVLTTHYFILTAIPPVIAAATFIFFAAAIFFFRPLLVAVIICIFNRPAVIVAFLFFLSFTVIFRFSYTLATEGAAPASAGCTGTRGQRLSAATEDLMDIEAAVHLTTKMEAQINRCATVTVAVFVFVTLRFDLDGNGGRDKQYFEHLKVIPGFA